MSRGRRTRRIHVAVRVILAVLTGLWAGYAWGSGIQSVFWQAMSCLGFSAGSMLALSELRDET